MEKTKEELMVDVNKKLTELNELEQTESLVKNNVNEFVYKEKFYRVHKPVAFEKDEINKERMKKYYEFLKDSNYIFRKQLIDLLKNKGVNIIKMEEEAQNLYNSEKELLKCLAITTLKDDVDSLKQKIQTIRDEAQYIFLQKEELLKYCIEKQLEDFVQFYLLYLVLEVKNNDKWEKVYKSYEEFQKSDDDLILGRASQVLAILIYHVDL